MLQRFVQDVAETAATETRVECRRQRRVVGKHDVRLIAGAFLVSVHGHCRGVLAGIGLAQLGEAVHPPVAWHYALRAARARNRSACLQRQGWWQALRGSAVHDDIGTALQLRPLRDHGRERRVAVLVQIATGQPQRMLGAGQADI